MRRLLRRWFSKGWAPVEIPSTIYSLVGIECGRCGAIVRSFDEHLDHQWSHSEEQRREWHETMNGMRAHFGLPPESYSSPGRDETFETAVRGLRPLW